MECKLCEKHVDLIDFTGNRIVCNSCLDVVRSVNEVEWLVCEYCGILTTPSTLSRSRTVCRCNGCRRPHVLDIKKDIHARSYKEYYNANREKLVAKSQRWNMNNKKRYYALKKAYRERHKHDLDFRIKENLGTRLRQLVRKDGNKFIEFLDCNLEFFKDWLQFNMSDEMCWENYGSYWHIDHAIPCSAFNVENMDEVKQCWHWSNLVPLEASKNASKINKIDREYIDFYKVKKEMFLNDYCSENK